MNRITDDEPFRTTSRARIVAVEVVVVKCVEEVGEEVESEEPQKYRNWPPLVGRLDGLGDELKENDTEEDADGGGEYEAVGAGEVLTGFSEHENSREGEERNGEGGDECLNHTFKCILSSMRLLALILVLLGVPVSAQEVHQELKETVRAEVLEIVSEETRDIIGTDTDALVQEVEIRILEGERAGTVVTFENDYMPVEKGERIYVNRLETIGGIEYYMLKDADRTIPLITLGTLFILTLLAFSGMHGARALLSLALSVLIIFTVLVPLLLAGYAPVLVSVPIAGVMLAIALFITHGRNARSSIAFLGTFGAVFVTALLATFWVEFAQLTGLSSDEAIFLNFSTRGALDFGGLLLASIVIGILGVLDDVAITQAAVVLELKRANAYLSFRELYTRALRVGRDHVGSLVNTLAFAYVGVALPLVLLLVKAESELILSLNQELVAVELVRIFIGSIGLILAVPFTTAVAGWWWGRYPVGEETTAHGGHYGHHHT